MALTQLELDNLMTWVLLIIAIILVAIILYISTRLIAGKKDTDTGYIIRLLLVAIAIVVLVAVVIGAIISALGQLDPTRIVSGAAAQLIPILIYLAIVYLIKFVLIPERGDVTKWSASVWIGVITLFFIYLINILTTQLFEIQIIDGV